MAAPLNLRVFQGQNRLLLVFAPNAQDPRYQTQEKALAAHRDGLAERDVMVFRLFEEATSQAGDMESYDPEAAHAARQQFDVPAGTFALRLIGKDGGVKHAQDAPIKMEDLFARIDAMPMRQDEMHDDQA